LFVSFFFLFFSVFFSVSVFSAFSGVFSALGEGLLGAFGKKQKLLGAEKSGNVLR